MCRAYTTVGLLNFIFCGLDIGGECSVVIFATMETWNLCNFDPRARLVEVLAPISDHPINCKHEVLPWKR